LPSQVNPFDILFELCLEGVERVHVAKHGGWDVVFAEDLGAVANLRSEFAKVLHGLEATFAGDQEITSLGVIPEDNGVE
jgi:hypothetical protein